MKKIVLIILIVMFVSASVVFGAGPFIKCKNPSTAYCKVKIEQINSVVSSVYQKYFDPENHYSDTHLVIKGLNSEHNKIVFTLSNTARSGEFNMNEIMQNCFKFAQLVKVDPDAFDLVLSVRDKHLSENGTYEFSQVSDEQRHLKIFFDYYGFEHWKNLGTTETAKTPKPPKFNVHCDLE